ncbi:MAG: OmpH family outer membrane protein [Rikenellaceae bacterium]
MKKKILIFLLAVISTTVTFAQTKSSGKVAYMYSEKVFKSMPEYMAGIAEIEKYAEYGQKMSESKLEEVQSMFNEFKKVESSLSATSRESLKNQIIAKEKAANEYEENFFKEGGALDAKQKEIMEPIEKKVLDAVNAVALANDYDMIFDLSTSKSTIYQKAQLDITNEIINRVKK